MRRFTTPTLPLSVPVDLTGADEEWEMLERPDK